jgi:hypothetical protein
MIRVHQVSDWGSGVAIKMGRQQGGASRTGTKKEHIWMLYVTKEQRSRRPIFIANLRAARLLAGCFVAHPAKIRSSATTPVTDLVH